MNYTATAETALMSAYMLGQSLPQHEQFAAAQAHYMAGLDMAAALALLPKADAAAWMRLLDGALIDLAGCLDDDVAFAAGTVTAIRSNILARAAGMLAQADIDAAMDAVRQEMEFDNLLSKAA